MATARPGKCALCSQGIHSGQFIGLMPLSWRPEQRCPRWARWRCLDALPAQAQARAERLGVIDGAS